VSPKDINHLLAVWRTSCGGAAYFCRFSEIRWSHNRWRYNGELFDILVTEIIEAVHRASRDTPNQALAKVEIEQRQERGTGCPRVHAAETMSARAATHVRYTHTPTAIAGPALLDRELHLLRCERIAVHRQYVHAP
jgi:hypothetical protein